MAKFYWDSASRQWRPHARSPARSRGPAIHRDQLDALWAPFNGQRYDSKSRMLADAKALGLECVGNDSSIVDPKPRDYKPDPTIGADVARAYDEVASR